MQVGAVLSFILVAQSLHQPPNLPHAPFTTDKGILPLRLLQETDLLWHTSPTPSSCPLCAPPSCTSLLHLPLPLQVYNIITQKMRAIAHEQFTCACKCILPLFDYDGCVWGAYQTSGDSWPLGGISTNLYLSVSTMSVPSRRHAFHFIDV